MKTSCRTGFSLLVAFVVGGCASDKFDRSPYPIDATTPLRETDIGVELIDLVRDNKNENVRNAYDEKLTNAYVLENRFGHIIIFGSDDKYWQLVVANKLSRGYEVCEVLVNDDAIRESGLLLEDQKIMGEQTQLQNFFENQMENETLHCVVLRK